MDQTDDHTYDWTDWTGAMPPTELPATVDSLDWAPLDDDELEAQAAAQVDLAELAEWWEDPEEASTALYRKRRRLSDYLFTPADLDKIPPVKWLIDGVLPEDAIALLYAEPGAGKSFVALDWAAHLACGKEEWEGRALKKDAKVLYIYAEGAPGLRLRRDAWNAHHGCVMGDNLWFIIRAANFLATEGGEDSEDDWSELLRICDELEPDLLIVDTLSRAIPGADENDQATMSALVDRFDILRERAGWSTVLLVHHTNAAGTRERGSTVLSGAINTRVRLSDGVLAVTKQKDDQEPVLGRLELSEVEGTESVVPTYHPVEDEDGEDKELSRRWSVILALRNAGGSMVMKDLHEAVGGGKGVLLKCLTGLETEGVVSVLKEGRTKRVSLQEEELRGRTTLAQGAPNDLSVPSTHP